MLKVKPVNICIVDDDPSCRDLLVKYTGLHLPDGQVAGQAATLAEGLELLRSTQPEVLFLDVHLPDGTGFDLLDLIPKRNCSVIFTTAYDDFALKAFRYNAIDYLLKPIDPDLLLLAWQKITHHQLPPTYPQQLEAVRHSVNLQRLDKIALNTSDGLIFVQIEEIERCDAFGNYCYVFLTNKEKYLVNRNLKDLEELLPATTFFRIHQSHLINITRIRKILKEDGGYVVMQDNARLPIARRRKEALLQLLNL